MADDPTFKRGDTRTPLIRQLRRSVDGGPFVPLEIPTGTTVRLVMRSVSDGTTTVVTQTAVKITDPTGAGEDGWLQTTWDADDLSVAGVYDAEHELTYPDGTIETVPNDGYFTVTVKADLG